MSAIATVTFNPAVDKCVAVPQVLPEQKLRCNEPEFHPGGGGINVARAIQELGGEATAVWMCGGISGELLKSLLDKCRLKHEPIPIQRMTRENLNVFEESSGQQFRFGMPGANLSEAEIETCLNRIASLKPPPEFLVLSGSLPPDVDEGLYARVIRSTPEECKIVLDTSGPPLKRGLEARVYLIKPNIAELGQLAGTSVETDAQIESVARSLIDEGKTEVVITSLGSGGAVLTTADDHQQIRAPTVRIRSKVGAGDSMVAGIVLGLSQGKPIRDAARQGVAAGSAAVMTEGTELCRRQDVERLDREIQGQKT